MHLSLISTQTIEKSGIKKVITYNFIYALVDFENIIAIETKKKSDRESGFSFLY